MILNDSNFDWNNKVANVKKDEYDSYVGRGTMFGNPFRLTTRTIKDRRMVLDNYESYFWSKEDMILNVKNLRGQCLGCSCLPLPCHAQYLWRLANIEEFWYEEQVRYLGFVVCTF